jgi:hypothetical protein
MNLVKFTLVNTKVVASLTRKNGFYKIMRKPTLTSISMYAHLKDVTRNTTRSQILISIYLSIKELSHFCVIFVEEHSLQKVTLKSIRVGIYVRKLLTAKRLLWRKFWARERYLVMSKTQRKWLSLKRCFRMRCLKRCTKISLKNQPRWIALQKKKTNSWKTKQ